MRRKTGLLLLLLLVLLCSAAAAASGSCGKHATWDLDDSGVMRIEGTGAMADGAFWSGEVKAKEIKKLVIAEGITRIGDGNFEECPALRSVSLPSTLTAIGDRAFSNCNRLKSVTLPENISEIGEDALLMETELLYAPWDSLTARTMGRQNLIFVVRGTKAMYQYTFDGEGTETGLVLRYYPDQGKDTLEIPQGVTEIAPNALHNAVNAVKIIVPDSVKELTTASFAGLNRAFYISCGAGSAAEKLALDQGLQYDNGTVHAVGYDIADAQEKADWIIRHYIRAGMSDRKKARVLHNWLVNNGHYDETKTVYDMEALLTKGYGVCEAYTYAYEELLSRAKVACGHISSDSMSHIWNVIRLDGKWYHADVTWDDPGNGPKEAPPISGNENTRYYLVNDSQLKQDHQWESYLSADNFKFFKYYDPEYGRFIPHMTWYDSAIYELNWKNRTASLYVFPETYVTSLKIPDKLRMDEDGSFTVTVIQAGAARGNRFLKTLAIGKNVKSIGKNAFRDCEKLKTITINTTKLTSKNVGANAFKNIRSNAKIKCPAEKLKAYKKWLPEKGVPKKAVIE